MEAIVRGCLMDDFKKLVRSQALCGKAGEMRDEGIISMSEYYHLIRRFLEKYRDKAPSVEDECGKGGDM